MIRRSSVIALVAIAVSLLAHFFGLGFTGGVPTKSAPTQERTDVVSVSNAFEDLAETVAEPVEPEPIETAEPEPEKAPEPEPPKEDVPEPEEAEVPTTEVLVASPNPQETFAPDTGSVQPVRPDATGPADFESGTVPDPKTVQPAGGDDQQITDDATPPVEPDTVTETAQGTPEGAAEPVEDVADSPEPETVTAPVAEEIAALPPAPVTAIPITPVAPTPSPATVPVVPVLPQDTAPEGSDPADTPEASQNPETDEAADGTDQVLTASLRPRLPTRRPTTQREGAQDGSSTRTTKRSRPPLIESPLSAYRRNGTDLNILEDGGTRSGGEGFQNARGPGNSDVTNYAGRVLVHLNRVPAVRVAGRGWARVFFEINPDGSVGSIGIIESSGNPDIERAARAQIRIAEPMPRPPNGNVRRLSFVYQSN